MQKLLLYGVCTTYNNCIKYSQAVARGCATISFENAAFLQFWCHDFSVFCHGFLDGLNITFLNHRLLDLLNKQNRTVKQIVYIRRIAADSISTS